MHTGLLEQSELTLSSLREAEGPPALGPGKGNPSQYPSQSSSPRLKAETNPSERNRR